MLKVENAANIDTEHTYDLLTGASSDLATSVRTTGEEAFGGLGLWLALHETGFIMLSARGGFVERGFVPDLFSFSTGARTTSTMGLVGDDSLALLAQTATRSPGNRGGHRADSFELIVRAHGAGRDVANRLVRSVRAWDSAGRPLAKDIRIRAHPRGTASGSHDGSFVIEKPSSRLVLDWA